MLGFIAFFFFTQVHLDVFFYTCASAWRAPPQKRRFPQFLFANIVLYFGPTKYIVRGRFLPHHHHRSSVLLAPSGLTSCTSRATPGKSRCHLQPICSLMPVPGSGRRSPLFLGASTMTNQNADDDDGNIHENIEAEGNRMRAR